MAVSGTSTLKHRGTAESEVTAEEVGNSVVIKIAAGTSPARVKIAAKGGPEYLLSTSELVITPIK